MISILYSIELMETKRHRDGFFGALRYPRQRLLDPYRTPDLCPANLCLRSHEPGRVSFLWVSETWCRCFGFVSRLHD